MKDTYFQSGWAINEDYDVVPVYSITSSHEDVTCCYFDNALSGVQAVYGVREQLKPMKTVQYDYREKMLNMLMEQSRGRALALLFGVDGIILVKSWEDFEIQVQPYSKFTGNEPTKAYHVDIAYLDEDADEYAEVMEVMYTIE